MLRNSSKQFGWVSIAIHWLMAAAIIGMFGLGVWMVDLDYYDPWYHRSLWIHQSIGMLLIFLLAFRLVWRLTNPVPEIMGLWWEKRVHRGHYLLMAAVMITGYLITTAYGRGVDIFGWFEFPALLPADKGRETTLGFWHMLLAWGFMGYIGMHAGAALKHHFIDKDITLLRMLGMNKKNRGDEK
ncbi:cytochrome b [Pseudomonadota bacterium]